MADLTPNNREELWLQGMVDGQTTLEPNKRREYWYKEIVDAIGSGGGGGTGGGVLVVSPNMDTGVLDKTWKEITDAPFAVLKFTDDNITYGIYPLTSYDEKAQGVYYNVTFKVGEAMFTGVANNPNDYPALQ